MKITNTVEEAMAFIRQHLEPEFHSWWENQKPEVQILAIELFRTGKEVRETNFRGTPDDRFKAWRDRDAITVRWALATGICLHDNQPIKESDMHIWRERLAELEAKGE